METESKFWHLHARNYRIEMIPFQKSRFGRKLGLYTENPFTQTPAKKALSKVGLGLDYARSFINGIHSTNKKVEWHTRSERAKIAAFKDMAFTEFEDIIFDADDSRRRAIEEPAMEAVLNASDATQEEVDYLVGIRSKDPKPMRRINYNAGNTQEGRIVAVFPGPKPVRFMQETEGGAQIRTEKERDELISQDLFGDERKGIKSFIEDVIKFRKYNQLDKQLSIPRATGVARKPLHLHRWIEAWGHKIPLPSKKVKLEFHPSPYSH
jgi:hypothetical protein